MNVLCSLGKPSCILGLPQWLSGKESVCSVGDTGDAGSVPGPGRSPGEGNGNSSILAWKIPWAEESGGLQSMGLKESETTERLSMHARVVY